MSETMKLPPEFNSWNEVWAEHQLRGKMLRELQSQIAALTERAERAEKERDAARAECDMSRAVFPTNASGGIFLWDFPAHSFSNNTITRLIQCRDAHDTARREAGRDSTDSAVARVEGER